ncbi:hypothetical protein [Caulobacter sp. UNC279MFTsu5.1]|uniref:hypothetical protein n=1 Tax=Caulobacter sp. UNC279MFTsu5.1 TaxID=1502775 RepID=UPI0008E6A935|nr:hypothetical protein [Caulobacter sp. UNC279MFTsu5.1]SFJ58698.1 hypothetical protein SAMN02799626_02124 [Caulobacter sp. UNC279MFTsu5.1]
MGMIRSAALAAIATAAVMALPATASAYTHCTATVTRIWAGDNGHVFIDYMTTTGNTAGAVVMTPTNPNREAVLSLAITAMTTSRKITARYTPDGASCAGAHFDVEGVYLEP